MPIPALKEYESFWQNCGYSQLVFRTACNQAVPPASRPIKKRVLCRIYDSAEARPVLESLYDPKNRPTEAAFALSLTQDLRWQTLVLEHVAEEKKWSDLFGEKTFDRIKAMFEKLADAFKHPAAKAATAAVISVAGIAVANDAKLLTLHVQPDISTKDGKAISLPFTLDVKDVPPLTMQIKPPDAGTSIPVNLQMSTGPSQTTDPAKTLQDVVSQLSQTDSSIAKASNDIHSMSSQSVKLDTSGLDPLAKDIATQIGGVSEKVNGLNQKLATLQTEMTAYDKAQKANLETVNDNLKTVALASQHVVVPLTLKRGEQKSIALPFLDVGSGKSSTQAVYFTLKTIGVDGRGRYADVLCKTEDNFRGCSS